MKINPTIIKSDLTQTNRSRQSETRKYLNSSQIKDDGAWNEVQLSAKRGSDSVSINITDSKVQQPNHEIFKNAIILGKPPVNKSHNESSFLRP